MSTSGFADEDRSPRTGIPSEPPHPREAPDAPSPFPTLLPGEHVAAADEAAGRVKLTVNLPEREMRTLRTLAAKRDISLTDAVRRAIAMEQFIEELQADGSKLLVEQPDRTLRQLMLR